MYVKIKLLAICKYKDFKDKETILKYEVTKTLRPSLFSMPIVNKLVSFFDKNYDLLKWADVIHCRGHGPSLI